VSRSLSGGSVKLPVSLDIHDVRELTGRLVVVADGRVESMRRTRETTAGDVLAMSVLGESGSVLPAEIVPMLR
jgi:hypothetical protein